MRVLSQEELADKAGVARSTVIAAERGYQADATHEMRPSTLRKLARVLGVNASDLVLLDD